MMAFLYHQKVVISGRLLFDWLYLSTPEQLVIGDLIILIAAPEALLAKRKSAFLPLVRIGFNFKCSKHSQRFFGLVGFWRNVVFIQPFGRLKSNHRRHLVEWSYPATLHGKGVVYTGVGERSHWFGITPIFSICYALAHIQVLTVIYSANSCKSKLSPWL